MFPIVGTAIMAVAAVPALAARGATRRRHAALVMLRAGARARDGDAGAGDRGPERGRLPRPGGGDLRRDVLPLDRRLVRRGGFGAIFANQLATELAKFLPIGAHIPASANPQVVKDLPAGLHTAVVNAFAAALQPVFLVATGITVIAFALTFLLQEIPLRSGSDPTPPDTKVAEPEPLTTT